VLSELRFKKMLRKINNNKLIRMQGCKITKMY
jgi:hypothetical protein